MSTEPPSEPSERRRHERFPTDLSGTLDCDGEIQCKVLNVSRSGAFAISSHPLPEMAQVNVRLQVEFPGEQPESLHGEAAVVRCDRRPDGDYDVGLFFTSLDPEATELLQKILESQTIPTKV